MLVFSKINHIENFGLYALSGLVFWNFISASILQVLTSFIDNASILKSINLHPFSFPLSAIVAALINLALTLVPFFILMFFLGYQLNFSILAVIPLLLITAIFILGIGMALGTLNVFFRDIQLLWTTIIPAFFYFTPIAYTPDLLPESTRYLLKLNPFYYFIESYHDIFYRSVVPNSFNLMVCTLLALFTFLLGYTLFKKYRKGFISNI
jgi:ABC-type polysaccharide/polyol phosphate export permease